MFYVLQLIINLKYSFSPDSGSPVSLKESASRKTQKTYYFYYYEEGVIGTRNRCSRNKINGNENKYPAIVFCYDAKALDAHWPV